MTEYVIKQKLMGSAFSLGVVADSEEKGNYLLQIGVEEIIRIEKVFSEFLIDSMTNLINNEAQNRAVLIDKECFELIERCLAISKLTNGDFDITVSPLKRLYRFKNDHFEMPDNALIAQTLENVGYGHIHLDKKNSTIFFNRKLLKIGFGAIGKGYASDRVKQLWLRHGVQSGYINASGDLTAFGLRPDLSVRKIAIANPDNITQVLLHLPLTNASVATSGDTIQHFIWQGKRYSHNINPHTGRPLTGIKSVTVFSPSAELSDALATAVYVKGVEKGINFINQLPQTHCVIINEHNKVFFSKKLKYEKATV